MIGSVKMKTSANLFKLLLLVSTFWSQNRITAMEQAKDIQEDLKRFNVQLNTIVQGRIETIEDGYKYAHVLTIPFSSIAEYESRSDAVGKFIAACIYEISAPSKKEQEKALPLYLQAGEAGCVAAYNNMGWIVENADSSALPQLEDGQPIPTKDIALSYYKMASKHPKGKFNMTRLLALTNEDSETMCTLGEMYIKGQGIEGDPGMALYWFLRSAYLGNVHAEYMVGNLLKNGERVTKNIPEAIAWFEKGAAHDHIPSLRRLGELYYYGERQVKKDLEKSFIYRKRAAALGDHRAIANIAWMLERGEGTTQDLQAALAQYKLIIQETYYKESALYHAARICDLLGENKKAVEFYEKILEPILHELEEDNRQGSTLYSLVSSAFRWYSGSTPAVTLLRDAKSTHGGQEHVDALYRLAKHYEKGLGTEAQPEKAHTLFLRAARSGHMPSKIKLLLVKKGESEPVHSPEQSASTANKHILDTDQSMSAPSVSKQDAQSTKLSEAIRNRIKIAREKNTQKKEIVNERQAQEELRSEEFKKTLEKWRNIADGIDISCLEEIEDYHQVMRTASEEDRLSLEQRIQDCNDPLMRAKMWFCLGLTYYHGYGVAISDSQALNYFAQAACQHDDLNIQSEANKYLEKKFIL